MQDKVINVDKPSLHWPEEYHYKVDKIIARNERLNSSDEVSIYNKVPYFFDISWMDFLPCFIGWFYSLFASAKTYGIIRSTTIFNKELYWYFKKRMVWAGLIHVLFGPVLIFIILFFCPIVGYPDHDVFFQNWKDVIDNFFSNGGQEQASKIFAETIIKNFIETDAWWITLIFFVFAPCFNISTLFSFYFLNPESDQWMKLIILENEMKMKLSNFEKEKGSK
ncbi:MAG: hypothetical protein K2H56_03855 [Malacoplasma sp.]|nr:hypothetical protein [Malacoplasma sp.]MDE7099938.1 hypothetical protein [Malacoplasma sp.]